MPAAEVRAFAARTAQRRTTSPDVAYGARAAIACSFDAFIRLHGARRRRGARQARDDRARRGHRSACLAPQAPGLLAASHGLSALFADDHAMLRCGHAGVRRALRVVPVSAKAAEAARATRRVTEAPRAAAPTRRGVPLLAASRLHQLRRPGRPDRADASRAGRRAALDFRSAIPARAQLLHAAARSGGAAARDVHRLAHASHLGRHRRGRAVRAAVAC